MPGPGETWIMARWICFVKLSVQTLKRCNNSMHYSEACLSKRTSGIRLKLNVSPNINTRWFQDQQPEGLRMCCQQSKRAMTMCPGETWIMARWVCSNKLSVQTLTRYCTLQKLLYRDVHLLRKKCLPTHQLKIFSRPAAGGALDLLSSVEGCHDDVSWRNMDHGSLDLF